MKTKNILMSILLVMGSIAAKAAGYPPELALVSQPVMVYNYNSITVYYDVENIGDYTYRGYVSLFLEPDYGYAYAEKYVRVYPGRIKRIAIDIPLHRIDRRYVFTIMPYYELGDELYSFTTFEYFEPLDFYWNGPRTERWIVITAPPRIRHYHRPGTYRYYYDGFRPPMPPPGHGPGMPPPMDPMHHTYGYHHNNGGYPATHPEIYNGPADAPASNHNVAPSATVRPKANGGSMSSGSSTGNTNNNVAPTSNGGSSSSRVNSSNSGRTGNTSTGSNSSSSRMNSSSSSSSSVNSGTSSSSGRVNSSSSGRVNSSSSGRTDTGTSTRPVINSGNSSRTNSGTSSSRSTGTSNSGSSRASSSSSSTRSSGTSSSSTRSSSSSSSSRSSSSSSSSSRGGSSSGRR